MSDLEQRWDATWKALGVAAPQGAREDVWQRYCERHRNYHTLVHLQECFERFDELSHFAVHPTEIELALWYHDAVYDVTRHDNEEQSAGLARRVLVQAGVEAGVADRVSGLIMATRHAAQPVGVDAQILNDVDLSILAAAPIRFNEYERQIRQEYRDVPKGLFTQKRREVLQAFLERPSIYSTTAFQVRYEAAARANLRESIEHLGGNLPT